MHVRMHMYNTTLFIVLQYSNTQEKQVKLQPKTWAIIRVFKMLDVVAVAITVGFVCFLVLVNRASETSSSLLPSRRIPSTNNKYSANVYSNDCCL